MPVQFLSDAYMTEGSAALATDAAVREAIEGIDIGLLFEVKDGPDGDFTYYMKIGNGRVELARGILEHPSATVRNSYATAGKLVRNELSNQVAFLTGRVRISGNVGVLMKHGSVLDLIQSRLGSLDIQY
jgi:hypothetical protein